MSNRTKQLIEQAAQAGWKRDTPTEVEVSRDNHIHDGFVDGIGDFEVVVEDMLDGSGVTGIGDVQEWELISVTGEAITTFVRYADEELDSVYLIFLNRGPERVDAHQYATNYLRHRDYAEFARALSTCAPLHHSMRKITDRQEWIDEYSRIEYETGPRRQRGERMLTVDAAELLEYLADWADA